ncbi:glycosyltransferase [Pseudomonas sp. MM211]|uniref:glycosyltransferase n=1 Tax=Pseudomonas sp. MM211 TaxID=2866808 RepID=UPI001CEC10B2|nr:glycosyltransferase [Pseudomonas sp. MM211]UCJ14700.1 glycosyltransferase [Pseudomonas sp. MM211]
MTTREQSPLVSVFMLTYNHVGYIREAIESVLAQRVDFPIELVIADDASSDGTDQVCQELADAHPEVIRYFRHAQNIGMQANGRFAIAQCRGKYLARLEGDDYMLTHDRLQEQADWLEAHENFSLCYGRARIVSADGKVLGQLPAAARCKTGLGIAEMLQENLIPACTAFYRAEFLRTYPAWCSTVKYGDYVINILAADAGKIHFIDRPISAYRTHAGGVTWADTVERNLTELLKIYSLLLEHENLKATTVPLAQDALAAKARALVHPYIQAARFEEAHAVCRQVIEAVADRSEIVEEFEGVQAKCEPYLLSLRAESVAPQFSVVLTTYNRPELLTYALASLGQQSMTDFEVILVNDHGEPVEHLLQGYQFPITYVRLGTNGGLSAARNAGLRLACGRYVCYLDDDDIYLPDHLAIMFEALEKNPQCVVYSAAEYVNERVESGQRVELGKQSPFRHSSYDRDHLFSQNYIPVNTWAHPRSMLAAVGEFDTGLSAFEDWDMLLRLAARYTFVHVPLITAQVRLRDAPNTGTDHMLGREQKNFAALYLEMYRRHGDGGNSAVIAGRARVLQRFGITVEYGRSSPSMQAWLDKRSLTPVQRKHIAGRLEGGAAAPRFGVVILDNQGDHAALVLTLASLERARFNYEKLQAFVLTPLSDVAQGATPCQVITLPAEGYVASLNALMNDSAFDWCLLMRAGDELTQSGLMMAGLELLTAPDCRAIYCDEMFRQEGQLAAAFRPAFNLDYLLSFPAGMAKHWLFRRDVVVAAGGFDPAFEKAPEFELILRLISEGGLDGLGHVAEPLLITDAPALVDSDAEQRAISLHLQQRGYQNAVIGSAKPGRYQIDYGHGQTPLVSLLIVAGERLEPLQRCVESILENTRYANYELLLIQSHFQDEQVSAWLAALASLGEARIRVLPAGGGQQAPQSLINQAAQQAHGDYLLLLSADAAAISDDWLDELLNHGQRPEVGCVGAKLLSADGKIFQASLILGLEGPVGRPYTGEPMDAPGYMQRLQVAQNSSAVGHDCLLVEKALFFTLGGLSESEIPFRFAGADLCLKARQAGYLTVWTPFSQLMLDRADSSRGTAAEHDDMYAKWLPILARDPAYNPNFSLSQPGGFKLADTALSWRPLSSWKPLATVLAHPADSSGSGHYRVMQPFMALQQAGLVDGAISSGLMHVADLERYEPDVIVLQRQIGDDRIDAMRRMQALSRALKVYELDDYLPNLPMKSIHRAHMPRDILRSMRRGLSYVDRFVVSTQPLADACRGLHDDIRVMANCLPVAWWKGLHAQRRVSTKPRVGWAGSISHTGDLEMIADVVSALADEVDWVFMGMCPEKIRPFVKEIHRGVDINSYPQALAALNLDLAVAPLEENLFNECKSNLRLLEFGACGFPVVCSDVPSYEGDLPVTRVKNRYRDWVDAIRMHVADLDATARAGDALQQQVMRDWMLEGDNLIAWQRAWLPD